MASTQTERLSRWFVAAGACLGLFYAMVTTRMYVPVGGLTDVREWLAVTSWPWLAAAAASLAEVAVAGLLEQKGKVRTGRWMRRLAVVNTALVIALVLYIHFGTWRFTDMEM